MKPSDVPRAIGAAVATASVLGLTSDDVVVLHNSNRLALRLLPCGVLARVAPQAHQADAVFEVEVARRLADTGSPVAELDPRVEPLAYLQDGFVVTLWTYHDPVSSGEVPPPEYSQALERLHAGMRQAELAAPHFTDRVAEAQRLVGNSTDTPELGDADRELLSNTLRGLTSSIIDRGADEQLLHGEPHPGNMLRTTSGLLFVDLETCCVRRPTRTGSWLQGPAAGRWCRQRTHATPTTHRTVATGRRQHRRVETAPNPRQAMLAPPTWPHPWLGSGVMKPSTRPAWPASAVCSRRAEPMPQRGWELIEVRRASPATSTRSGFGQPARFARACTSRK